MSENSPVDVSVQILQKHYRLRCLPEDAESLQKSARMLDQYMREMRDSLSSDVFNNEKLAIAVAINLIGSLARQERQLEEFEQHANQLKSRILEVSREVS